MRAGTRLLRHVARPEHYRADGSPHLAIIVGASGVASVQPDRMLLPDVVQAVLPAFAGGASIMVVVAMLCAAGRNSQATRPASWAGSLRPLHRPGTVFFEELRPSRDVGPHLRPTAGVVANARLTTSGTVSPLRVVRHDGSWHCNVRNRPPGALRILV